MIDDFDPADRQDIAIHERIDSDLATADRLVATEDRKRHFDEFRFPQLHAAKDKRSWLLLLLDRYVWNRDRAQAGAKWLPQIENLLDLCLRGADGIGEAEFLKLVEVAPAAGRSVKHFRRVAAALVALEKRGMVGDAAARAAYPVLQGCTRGSWPSEMAQLVWPLFRSAPSLAECDYGWSAAVLRDLAAVKPKERALWMRVINAQLHHTGSTARSSAFAIDKLGPAAVEERVRRWVAMLSETGALPHSPVGAILIGHLIQLCSGLAGCDELLYGIAQAPWTNVTVPVWTLEYLRALEGRPKDRAFACMEALTMHPAMAKRQELQRKYDALATMLSVRALRPEAVCIDGFPIETQEDLRPQHQRIDRLLRMAANAAAQGQWAHGASVEQLARIRAMREEEKTPEILELQKRLENDPHFWVSPEVRAALEATGREIVSEFSSCLKSLHRAASTRLEWIVAHRRDYTEDTFNLWWQVFNAMDCDGGLIQRSLAGVDSLSIDALLAAFRTGGRKAFELGQKYVDEHGWTVELVEQIREWVPQIGSALSAQMYRAGVKWFVWFEDVCPIALDECWSHGLKKDLREMPEEERAAWLALFDNHTFVAVAVPPRKWMEAAEEVFPRMDPAAFRRPFMAWFEPFTKPQPLRLTVTGRNILRELMWYALIAKDSAVDRALAGFAEARWKTKDALARAARAEMVFARVMAARDPEVALPILEKQVAGGRAYEGSESHKVYLELCEKANRTPVAAMPEKPRMANAPAAAPAARAPVLPAAVSTE